MYLLYFEDIFRSTLVKYQIRYLTRFYALITMNLLITEWKKYGLITNRLSLNCFKTKNFLIGFNIYFNICLVFKYLFLSEFSNALFLAGCISFYHKQPITLF